MKKELTFWQLVRCTGSAVKVFAHHFRAARMGTRFNSRQIVGGVMCPNLHLFGFGSNFILQLDLAWKNFFRKYSLFGQKYLSRITEIQFQFLFNFNSNCKLF